VTSRTPKLKFTYYKVAYHGLSQRKIERKEKIMWYGKKLLMLMVGGMLILGLVFSGCAKQDKVSAPEAPTETTEPAESPEPKDNGDQESVPATV
jgi:hypothetical protein